MKIKIYPIACLDGITKNISSFMCGIARLLPVLKVTITHDFDLNNGFSRVFLKDLKPAHLRSIAVNRRKL